jgi:hypothetical protein
MKSCSRCKRRLELASFHKDASKSDGRKGCCRECYNGLKSDSYKRKSSPVKRMAVPCALCGKEKLLWPSQKKRSKHHFCKREHYHAWLTENQRGTKNPNYGRSWGQAQRKRQSERTKERMRSPEARWKAGTANRGKKFSPARCRRMHEHRAQESYSHPNPSEETRRKIGEASRKKFTDPDYRRRHRRTMEEHGAPPRET